MSWSALGKTTFLCRFACFGFLHKLHIYIKNTTVYVPSSELGLSQTPTPFLASKCAPPPGTKGGLAHSPAGEGLGESQCRRLEKSLALFQLCGFYNYFSLEVLN